MNTGYTFRINKDFANFLFVNDTGEKKDTWKGKWSHYVILHKLINFMKSRGWSIEHDQEVHKCIRRDYWLGRKSDLEFRLERYPRGFSFEFFQNIVFENPHGGRYDFDKFKKMPYLIKLMYLNEVRHMKEFLVSLDLGIRDNSEPKYKLAEDKVKADYVECWHHPQKSMEEFELSDLDGTTCEYGFNNTDRDKKTILNGQIKYFRHWNGRLTRGKVYHNINNMWWVITNKFERRNIADFELFDPTEEDFKLRRKARDRTPREYIDRVEKVKQSSTKELLNELRRRKAV